MTIARHLTRRNVAVFIRRAVMVSIVFALGVLVGKEGFSSKAKPAGTSSSYAMPEFRPIVPADPARSSHTPTVKTDF